MVGEAPPMTTIRTDELAERIGAAYPELERARRASSDPVYLVGGAVRDLLLGLGRSPNVDLVVEGDAIGFAEELAPEAVLHERFATATARIDGLEVDVAAARTETYPEPGALPEIEPGASIEADLRRRDFTVNAIAIPLSEPVLIDPAGGAADLEAGLLRARHERSFADDPTRALRAARYAARLGLALEEATERWLRGSDLDTVSADRRDAELLRLAEEATAPRGFALLGEWGLVELREDGAGLAESVAEVLAAGPLVGLAPRGPAVLRAALGPPGAERELLGPAPERPSQAIDLAAGRTPVELALARALGAAWIDSYVGEWRDATLEIGGEDLVREGIPEGPAVGRGLSAALRQRVDGELEAGRDAELRAALAAARSDDGLA
jgi:tRNA nucleotidyltransferase (CCA-adding enzyme)